MQHIKRVVEKVRVDLSLQDPQLGPPFCFFLIDQLVHQPLDLGRQLVEGAGQRRDFIAAPFFCPDAQIAGSGLVHGGAQLSQRAADRAGKQDRREDRHT